MSRWGFQIVDVFTDLPLAGNQLAVFPDATSIPEKMLHPLAREINFSETVFLYPPEAGGAAKMRIFTPGGEIPFAGHPVLGTAVYLAQQQRSQAIDLETNGGRVAVRYVGGTGPAKRGIMRQPIPTIEPFAQPVPFLAALGIADSLLPVTLYDNGLRHVYFMVKDPDAVAALAPDSGALLRAAEHLDLPFIGVNVFSGEGTQWKTRMFAPGAGIIEDPATGSAAGPLALHLARNGLIPWGQEIQISQGAELGRPSTLFARVSGSANVIESVVVENA